MPANVPLAFGFAIDYRKRSIPLQSLQQLSSVRDGSPELGMEDSEEMLGLCAWLTVPAVPGRSTKEWMYC